MPETTCWLDASYRSATSVAGVFNKIARVKPEWLTDAYRTAAAPKGGVPVVVQGGTQIGTLNQTLGAARLALQTSGATWPTTATTAYDSLSTCEV